MKHFLTTLLAFTATLSLSAAVHQDPPPQESENTTALETTSVNQPSTESEVTTLPAFVQTNITVPNTTQSTATTAKADDDKKVNDLQQQVDQQQQILQMQQQQLQMQQQQMQQIQQQQMQMQIDQLQQQVKELNEESKRRQQAPQEATETNTQNNQTTQTAKDTPTTLPMLEPVLVAPVPEQTTAQVVEEEPVEVEHLSAAKKYYKKSGDSFLSIVSVGYSTMFLMPTNAEAAGLKSTEFAFKRHLINFEIFEWRAKCFGMQLFNFEMGINTKTSDKEIKDTKFPLAQNMRGGENNTYVAANSQKEMWFAYKPAIKFYIPCAQGFALELYGGAEIELSKYWDKVAKTYYDEPKENGFNPEDNYFIGAFGGLGLVFSGIPAMPLEIKAEYRHPVQGNTEIIPQGFYLSAQLHLGAPIHKKK